MAIPDCDHANNGYLVSNEANRLNLCQKPRNAPIYPDDRRLSIHHPPIVSI
jgi:hypothetical protein